MDIASNADMRLAQIRNYYFLDEVRHTLMKTAKRQLRLTARAYHRVLKLSCTIADLVGSQAVTNAHRGERLQYHSNLIIR